jgi:hypothetical protein
MGFKLSKEEQQLMTSKFKEAVSPEVATASAANKQIAQAIQLPLRETLLSGDILGNIFEPMDFSNNPRVEFPLDLLTPGQEREYYAYVIPNEGRIPERRVEGDYLMVPTFPIGNSIGCTLRFLRDANWPVIQRMIEILEAGFRKKLNDDGWQTILAAATDRNMIINDPNASAGQFTPRLVALLATFMRRNGGGNSTTLGRSKLTDLYLSPEGLMDVRAWTLDLVPDQFRAAIFNQNDTDPDSMTLWGVKIHALDELGEGQEYQRYYANTLNGTMAASDVEIAIGLDLQRRDSFVHPIREQLAIYEDNTVFRRGIFELFGSLEGGFAVLDSRRTLLASF